MPTTLTARRSAICSSSRRAPCCRPTDCWFFGRYDRRLADMRQVRGADVACDESALTGESDEVKKSAASPFLLSGTSVMKGTGARHEPPRFN